MPEARRLLDVDAGATFDEVKQAYHRMKALYSEGSLATYSLLSEEERSHMLYGIERAFLVLSVELREEGSAPGLRTDGAADIRTAAQPEPGESIGPFLRRRREQMGLPIKEIANTTRIRSAHLENIELERFDLLPAPVYLRGFVVEYGRALSLADPEGMAAAYMDLYRESEIK